jgi:hypothetical protein
MPYGGAAGAPANDVDAQIRVIRMPAVAGARTIHTNRLPGSDGLGWLAGSARRFLVRLRQSRYCHVCCWWQKYALRTARAR